MVVHEPTVSVGRGNFTAKTRGLRAVVDPIIVQHFGASAELLEEFGRVTEQIIKMSPQDEYPGKPRAFVAASLTRRTSSAELLEEFVRVTEQIIKMSPQDEYPGKPRAFVAASLARRT
jgi:regulator of sirC expression with transglutaminase-like and TPR domain